MRSSAKIPMKSIARRGLEAYKFVYVSLCGLDQRHIYSQEIKPQCLNAVTVSLTADG